MPSESTTLTAPHPTLTITEPTSALRGAVLVLGGRGDIAQHYHRLATRLAFDGYLVAVSPTAVRDAESFEALRHEFAAVAPQLATRVIIGVDSSAGILATALAAEPAAPGGIAGIVLAGTVVPQSPAVAATAITDGTALEEVSLRTACPVHARVLQDSAAPLLADDAVKLVWPNATVAIPTLVLHGRADVLAPVDAALAATASWPDREVVVLEGGHHDSLNDAQHRTAAARVVEFLERLRTGSRVVAIDPTSGKAL